ncbi:MAG TPA: inositol monophosphatase family protein [Minicystis sp.]|nr:inositol monophosphatase family protein [Minicystis sp.]
MSGATDARGRAQLASIARLVAEEAGALVMAGFRARPRAEEKGTWDLVTEFDRASQDLVLARLASLAPGIPVVAEEASDGTTKDQPGLVFYVDPLDGTTNFVHGHPFFAVAVGLMDDGAPVVGAVVAPALGVTWIGWVDADAEPGARRRGAALRDGAPCSTSSIDALGRAMLATGFPPQRDKAPENNFGSFLSVKRVAQAVRRCGSAAIDLCFVADGTYDGYWERKLHVWDLCAAGAIALAAGATITNLDGSPPDYHAGTIAASNGLVHAALLDAIARGAPLTGTY